jgi:uncharacterized protein DUF3179
VVGKTLEPSDGQVNQVTKGLGKRAQRIAIAVSMLLVPAMGIGMWLSGDNPFYLIVGAKIRKMPAMKMDIPGDTQPTFTSAANFPLGDHEIVIGVVAFGQAKAYVRRVFSGPGTHIVHDRFGKTQVTVTHCNRTRCTRVFTAADDQDLSSMHCGGWMEEQELALLIGSTRFPQSSEEIPFNEVPFVVTTWGKWRAKNPQSIVYLGSPEVAKALKQKAA